MTILLQEQQQQLVHAGLVVGVHGFSSIGQVASRMKATACHQHSMIMNRGCGNHVSDDDDDDTAGTPLVVVSASSSSSSSNNNSRRAFMTRTTSSILSTVAAAASGVITTTSTTMMMPVPPANALSNGAVGGINKVNAKLIGFGLPPITRVPDGYTPILDIYGKGKNRFPILVTFSYPLTWVLTTPSNNVNGEDGTFQVGDYNKGDTATLYLYEEVGHVDNIQTQSKELIGDALKGALTLKGQNMYQDFKITKLEPYTTSNGQKFMLAEFKYQLLTGAGFVVDRKAIATLTSEGNAIEVFWAATLTNRYKNTEPTLREVVKSFRCYTEGIKLATELVKIA